MHPTDIRAGLAAVDSEGHGRGTIKDVEHDHVLISRSMLGADAFAPVSSIVNAEHETVHLDRTRDIALRMGREQAPSHDELETGPDELYRQI
jgi:hypothetical protein